MNNKNGARWMIVDNDTDALKVVARLLEAVSGAQVSAFPSPWQALDAFANDPDSFQFIVTDYEMPGMNGVDFRRHIHAIAPSMKVLLITGGVFFTEESAVQNGFCGMLNKPFSLSELKQTIELVQRLQPESLEVA